MLHLIGAQKKQITASDKQAFDDHSRLLNGFLDSHRIRNHSDNTIQKRKNFLISWFRQHGPDHRPLFTWEAMEPITGRKRIVDYGNALLAAEISSSTIRDHLGTLARYFAYVLEHPHIFDNGCHHRIQDRYGAIDQPVSEYDTPVHSRDGDRLGIPMEPERLYEFYTILRNHYLGEGHHHAHARNYTLAVLAGETGLRINELLHLQTCDLFFDSHKIQTRFGKASRGSGKRSRLTLFTPLARDTVRFYLKAHREKKPLAVHTKNLFFSKSGKILGFSTVNKAIREMVKVAQHAGFPVGAHMSWHGFRRIFATRFIERFPNQLPVLIHLLGHSNPNTVHAYIRHSEAWMNRQIQSVLEGSSKWPSIGD